jgi:hypothetical protein
MQLIEKYIAAGFAMLYVGAGPGSLKQGSTRWCRAPFGGDLLVFGELISAGALHLMGAVVHIVRVAFEVAQGGLVVGMVATTTVMEQIMRGIVLGVKSLVRICVC